MIEHDWLIALFAKGQPFLDAEARLIATGQEALPFLQERARETQPLVKLLAEVLIQRINANEVYRACLEMIAQAERDTAHTVVGNPPPEWLAGKLATDFGHGPIPLLSVYLWKLAPIWANWKTMGVILYFGKLRNTTPAEALIDVIVTTPIEHYRKFAAESLVAIADGNVRRALQPRLEVATASYEALQMIMAQIQGRS